MFHAGLACSLILSPMFCWVMFRRLSSRMLPLLAADIVKEKDSEFFGWHRETHRYYNLTVKILKARNIHGLDLLSKADSYVALRLPTASPLVQRTQVVYNSSDPEWNETFEYRIHSAVKNILEFTFYNKDIVLSSLSNHATSVAFDTGNITPGEILNHTFVLNSQEKRAEVDVEFSLEESSHPPSKVITNGTLVLHPCLRIEGTINKSNTPAWIIKENCQINLSVPGSFENNVSTSCHAASEENQKIPFVFHVNKEISPELNLELLQTTAVLEEGWSEDLQMKTSVIGNGAIPVSELPLGKEVELTIPLGKDQVVDLTLKIEESSPLELDVRLGSDLSKGEREFLERRKEGSSSALKKILNLEVAPKKDEVPVVAVVMSGGGMRAMTSCYGNLSGLQKLGLLDILTYICGISGSTWCMSTLYEDSHWSRHDLQDAINNAQKIVTSRKIGAFSAEQLAYYFQELIALEKIGRKATLVDLWGLIIEYILHNKKDPAKLSDQQEAVRWGQNPYPIYAAQNVRTNVKASEFTEWCEFTPYEFGIYKYGASIRIEDYSSKFFMGLLLEKHQEPRICFLQGIWASAFAGSIDDIWGNTVVSEISFIEWPVKGAIRIVDEFWGSQAVDPSLSRAQVIMPAGAFTQLIYNLFKSRITSGENFNFLQGLYLHRDYVNDKEFVAWKGDHLDAVPNQLTPGESSLHLVDGAFANNSPFPLVLQAERDVDIILSFDYTWQAPFEWVLSLDGYQKYDKWALQRDVEVYLQLLKGLFLLGYPPGRLHLFQDTVLHQAQKYCEERRIPFPDVSVPCDEKRHPKECYMFLNDENPEAPIVLHFPLVNDTFKKFKAPGVKRETKEEISFADFHIYTRDTPYGTTNLTYNPIQFDRLLHLNCYNVINNQDAILKALDLAMKRRKLKKTKK